MGTYDGSNRNIDDGGNDMYDGGNAVFVADEDKNEVQLPYNDFYSFPRGNYYALTDAQSAPFHTVLWALPTENERRLSISVRSNTGADGNGYTAVSEGEIAMGSWSMKYVTFQIYGAGDPTICEVYYAIAQP